MRVSFRLNKNLLSTLLLTGILLSVSLIQSAMASDNKGYDHKLQIINQENNKVKATIKVKIADDEKSRSKGLMFAKALPQGNGMLFDFKEEKVINMWMKNTLISLDMIFIDKDDKIIRIVGNTVPLSQKIISSEKPALKVIELNAGVAQTLEIKIGDSIKVTKE